MVGDFTPVAGWMRFERLDRFNGPAHVLAWRYTDDGGEVWAKRLNAFKAADQAAIRGAAKLLVQALPKLMAHYHWATADSALTTALSSGDTKCVPTKALPLIGSAVATKLGVRWLPDILTKQLHRPMHSFYDAASRDAEAAKANYKCSRITGIKHLIVLDDLITMGNTQNNIYTAVKTANPTVDVHPIGLGKAERKGYANQCGVELKNEHVPAAWATIWDAG